jgi:hypothetical protein
MHSILRRWWQAAQSRRSPRGNQRRPARRLWVEWLEDRTLLDGQISALPFTAFQTAHAAGYLAAPNDFDQYTVTLQAGDQISAAVSAQTAGSGLQSVLRVFDPSGTAIALDDQEGGDPHLTFQAAATGTFTVGVSSAGDDAYLLNAAGIGQGGSTTGMYALDLRRTPNAPAQADLAGSSFRLLSGDTAAWGDQVQVSFKVENRGEQPADATARVRLVLSDSTAFAATSHLSYFSQVYSLAGLAQGQPYAPGPLTVMLPNLATAQAAGFSSSGPLYVGLQITDDQTQDPNPFDKSGVHRGEDWETLTLVTPAANGVTDLSQVDAKLNSRVNGTLSGPGPVNVFSFTVTSTTGAGRFTASVAATGGTLFPRLTLSAATGQLLDTTDAGALVQNLTPGTYVLAVSATAGAGGYRLTTGFIPSSTALNPITVGSTPVSVVVADVNGEGNLDLVVSNKSSKTVSVLLGNGDGTFGPQKTYAVGTAPYGVAVADVNGDGRPDIIVANSGSKTVSVLLGNGDGTFQPQKTFTVGSHPEAVTVADLNGDGKPDLIVGNEGGLNGTVSVLLGNGDGTFQPQKTYAVGTFPFSVVAADLNGDGIPDLVVANGLSHNGVSTVSVLLGNGDGTFQTQKTYSVGATPHSVVVADLNGDGKPDIVTANLYGQSVSVLLGNGDGTFQPQQTYAVGSKPEAVAVVDANGDGKLDLAVVNQTSNTVSVLLGNGDGTFRPQQTFLAGIGPYAVAVGDLNGDGKPDIVAAVSGNTVSVLLGNGDGSFQGVSAFAVGRSPDSIAVADLNGDGKPDLVVANRSDKTVSVLLGNGDGTFQNQKTFALGSSPFAVAVADVNGDGKPDILALGDYYNKTTKSFPSTVSVLLGNGDGTFQAPHTFAVDPGANSLAVADVNGDGHPDIVTANDTRNYNSSTGTFNYSSTVSVLLGNGDGTFGSPKTFAAGGRPDGVAVADLNGDGKPDLVLANQFDPYYYKSSGYGVGNRVSVLLGNGDGTFGPEKTFPVGSEFITSLTTPVVVADLDGDGKPDLIVENFGDYDVSVLLGNGDGTFQKQQTFPIGFDARALAVADFNGDGKPDLAVVNSYGVVSVLLGNGDGTFQPRTTVAVGRSPYALAVADLNGDGKPDLVTANEGAGTVSVRLGNGDGTFATTTPLTAAGLRSTPFLADLSGHHDGTLDSVVLDGSGDILFRQGLGGPDFAPPVTINASVLNPQTGKAEEVVAHDLTVLRTPTGWAVATADTTPDPALLASSHQFVYSVSLYTRGPDGKFKRTTAFTTPFLPTRIAAADLTGDGLDDIVVADALDNSVQVAFQQPDGTFGPPLTLPVGLTPSDIALVDVDGDGRKDIVVTDQASGDVTVLLNQGNGSFAPPERFRASTGLYGPGTATAGPTVASLAQSVSLVADNFTGSGRNDLVVVNRGADSFSVLVNDGSGGFADPQAALTTSTSDGLLINEQVGPVVAGDFNGDDKTDLAILMENRDEVWVYTNQGDGTFSHTITIAAGTSPTGLSVLRNPQTGFLDLLVGNPFGDILHLQGKGDGTFQAPGSRTSLGVIDLGNGQFEALVVNQQTDRVTLQAPVPGSLQFAPAVTLASGSQSTLAPGDGQLARLEGSNGPVDAVVLDSGGNDIRVYHGTGVDSTGNLTFDLTPATYPVGTDPVSVAIASVAGGSVPDMFIADQGSNDVATLVGTIANGQWVGTPGPRLKTGGSGPVAVSVVSDANSPGGNDLVVTNGQSGTMTRLPGVGQGFFNDQNPQTVVNLGTSVIGAPSFIGDSGRGVAVATDGQLLGFDLNTGGTAHPVFIPAAGQEVNAVQALPNGTLFVAERDGTVAELRPGADPAVDVPVAELSSSTGIPSDPSAIDVLNLAPLEVLVTNAGSDTIFVFGTSLAAPLTAQEFTLPGLSPGGAITETSSPTEAPLTVVLTFVAGLLPGDTTTLSGTPAGEFAAPVAAADQTVVAATGNGIEGMEFVQGASDNNDDGDGTPTDTPTDPGKQPASESEQTIKEMLRKLELYRRTPETIPLGPVTLQQMWELPRLGAEALAELWQAGSDWLTGVADPAAPPPTTADAEAEAVWLGWPQVVPGEPEAGALPTGTCEASPGSLSAAVGAKEKQPPAALDVRLPALGVTWGQTLLATLAAGGLALGAERQLLRAEEITERHGNGAGVAPRRTAPRLGTGGFSTR